METSNDEGVFYLTVSPTEKNPLTEGLCRIYKTRPVGVIRPNVFTLVPLSIHFRSVKRTSAENSKKMYRLIELTLTTLMNQGIDLIRKNIHQVVKWTDIVPDAVLKTYQGSGILKVEYGEAFRGILEFVISEFIRTAGVWERKYGYSVDIRRAEMDIMLLASCPGDVILSKFVQRAYDEDIKVSARQWEVGLSLRKSYIWKKPWGELVQRIVENETCDL